MFLIDYGLTTTISESRKYKFRGTPYFASNNALTKIGIGQKDDVESLMYILIYFFYGILPWEKEIPVLKEDIMSNLQVSNVIQARNPYQLCQDMDAEFGQMLQYLQELSSKKRPNYRYLREQFEIIRERNKLKYYL